MPNDPILAHYDPNLYCGLTLNLSVLQHNYTVLQEYIGENVRCSAVLKADGYGMGAPACAKALYDVGCRDFFVAYMDEAIAIRAVLPLSAKVYTFNGFLPGTEGDYLYHHIIPVLTDMEKVERFSALSATQDEPLKAALHIDTAMNRTGIRFDEIQGNPALRGRLQQHLKKVDIVLCISHFACSDEPENPMNPLQKKRFDDAVKVLFEGTPPPLSLSNSSGIALSRDYHYDLVRPGRGLHNIDDPLGLPLRPYGDLWTRIYQIQDINPGDGVGYDNWFKANKPCKIATLSFGYADGYVWKDHKKNQEMKKWAEPFVMIEGYRAPVVGRVSMDMMTVDVSDVPECYLYEGAVVHLMNAEITLNTLAKWFHIPPYEVILRCGKRVKKTYIFEKESPTNYA